MSEIIPIPTLPPELKRAAENKELAIFIGAGVSRLYGCDGWKELALNLIKVCSKSKCPDGSSVISYKEMDYLSKENNYKKVITICKSLLKEADLFEAYVDCLKKSMRHEEQFKDNNVFDFLYRMGLGGGLYLTTNADSHFSKKFGERLYYKESHFAQDKIDSSFLYHLHGTIRDINSLVFTVPEYLEKYSENNPNYIRFLRSVFNSYTVLFVGYGLEELEILEFMATKTQLNNSNPVTKRFLLFPLFKGEDNILRNEKAYFKSFGIELKAFEKDQNGYEQLVEVIKSWTLEIEDKTAVLENNYIEIEECSTHYSEKSAQKILHLVKFDDARRIHFFKCLERTSSPNEWLLFLYNKGFFNPANSPLPRPAKENESHFVIPLWEVFKFLEIASINNRDVPTAVITETLKKIIDENAKYSISLPPKERNDRTEWMLVKLICNLPVKEIRTKHISYVKSFLQNGYWGNTLLSAELGKLLFPIVLSSQNKNASLNLFEASLMFKVKKRTLLHDCEPVLGDYWLKELLDRNLTQLAVLYPLDSLFVVIKQIKKVLVANKYSFSKTWIPSITEEPDEFKKRYESLLIYSFSQLFDKISVSEVPSLLKALDGVKNDIGVRLKLAVFTKFFSVSKSLFWGRLGASNFLLNRELAKESHLFLKANARIFTSSELKILLKYIEEIEDKYEKDLELKSKYEAYRKRWWLEALASSNKSSVLKLIDKYEAINPEPIVVADFKPGIRFGQVEHKSPYGLDELKDLSVEEVVEKINLFQPNGSKRDVPDREGLAEVLEQLVKDNSQKYVEKFSVLLKIDYFYLHHVLRALISIKSIDRKFPWPSLLVSMREYVVNTHNWDLSDYNEYSYQEAFLKSFYELLKTETQNNKSLALKRYNSEVKEILLASLVRVKSGEVQVKNEAISLSYVTTSGVLHSTVLEYGLWMGRNHLSDHAVRWDVEFKHYFEQCLDVQRRQREVSVVYGRYFRNLLYLDHAWTWDSFDKIFSFTDDLAWADSFTGLLYDLQNVYDEIYARLKDKGHFRKALDSDMLNSEIKDKVIEQISIAYLHGMDELESNDLMYRVATGSIQEIKKCVFCLSRTKIKKSDAVEKRVTKLWDVIYNHLIKVESLESKKIIVDLSYLQKYFTSISSNVEKLKSSFEYSYVDYYPLSLIEMLDKYVSKEPEHVADLLLSSIKGGSFFSYKEELLVSVIEKLYKKGQHSKADQICIAYLKNGMDWFREIYKANRKD